MGFIADLILATFDWILTKPWELIVALLEWIVELVLHSLPHLVWSMLPDGLAEYLRTMDLTLLNDLISPVLWWIPFWPIMKIYFTAYTLAAAVRFVRFVVGLIPLVEG